MNTIFVILSIDVYSEEVTIPATNILQRNRISNVLPSGLITLQNNFQTSFNSNICGILYPIVPAIYKYSFDINDQINLKNVGPLKIVKDLEKIGISSFVIDKYIGIYSKEEQIDKIEKLVKKEIKLNNNKSSYVLKNKILVSLFNKGFYKEDIVSVLNGCDIDDESVMKREYDKLYKKLSNKYSGNELLYKVKQKMYQKGFKI